MDNNEKKLSEAVAAFQDAIAEYKKAAPFGRMNRLLNGFQNRNRRVLEQLKGSNYNRFKKQEVAKVVQPPKPRQVEEEKPQGKILADNGETPDALKEQKKRRRRKKKEE